jgi:bifunctional NMN adenylyltransferase/nudix hydrolase
MSNKMHKLAVYIGRFQPFHIGHRNVLEQISKEIDSTLILVGSSYRPRSWKNPFTFAERKGFIDHGTADMQMPVDTLPLVDTLYNDRSWASNVRTAVRIYMRAKGLSEENTEVILTGFEKDQSSKYLRWFPEWDILPASAAKYKDEIISATDLREAIFFPQNIEFGHVAARFGNKQVAAVVEWQKKNQAAYETVQSEGSFTLESRAKIAQAEEVFGYPIPINTADALVVQSGHILMIRRGHQPGKGTWALPGGHIRPNESSLEAALRECVAKTRIDMPKGAIEGRLRDRKVFDHPERSERGWVRTEAFYFELQDRQDLERFKDENKSDVVLEGMAAWVPISEITPDEIFEDHFDIIQNFVSEVSNSYTSILMAHVGGISK